MDNQEKQKNLKSHFKTKKRSSNIEKAGGEARMEEGADHSASDDITDCSSNDIAQQKQPKFVCEHDANNAAEEDDLDSSDNDSNIEDETSGENYEHPDGDRYTQVQLAELLERATTFCKLSMKNDDRKWQDVHFLYRNGDEKYWGAIEASDGIEKAHKRKSGGHAQNTINGAIKGLCFMTKHYFTRDAQPYLPDESPYGSKRATIHLDGLLNDPRHNLYFMDFYCYIRSSAKPAHYVTVVVTVPGSKADGYCSENGIKLDWHDENNTIIRKEFGQLQVSKTGNCWVELMYTEGDVPISDYTFSDVKDARTPGWKGRQTANTMCKICNVQGISGPEQQEQIRNEMYGTNE